MTATATRSAASVPAVAPLPVTSGRIRAAAGMLGPAFVASIAYVDPGNFATNIQSGARYGYLLLWVVLVANLMAMLVQYLSAKLGIVTSLSLPENIRERFPRPVTCGMWLQAEAMAMATDVAEFVGAALGLNLLFGIALLPAGLITCVITFGILALQARGYRPFELAIAALLGLVVAGFLYETLRIGPSAPASLHGLLPAVDGTGSLYLAAGILGATVMPHAVYLHSALTKSRTPCRGYRERRSTANQRPQWLLEADYRCADVGQRRAELPAGADPELSENLAQVPLHRARTEEQLGADLRVRLTAGSQARDLHLLRGQLVERLDAALPHCLAGGQQLAAGAFGERLHAHVR